MSSFVKKNIIVDDELANILGFEKGRLISYAEVTKGIYDYIKEHNLKRNEKSTQKAAKDRFCYKCGTMILAQAKFCDKCGRKQ